MAAEHALEEIASQPQVWRQAVALAHERAADLPQAGERIAAVGCGTSWFMAEAYARRRESLGEGWTDAFAASEFPAGRDYDRILAISRSGTTTEVLALLAAVRGTTPTVALIGDPQAPGATAADTTVLLPFADETSVVQTRFATSVLTLLRTGLGEDLTEAISAAERAVSDPLPEGLLTKRQYVFLGRGWTVGLAHEAALKMREASLAWSESYPAMDFRHGPISISDEHSVVWFFGEQPEGLAGQVASTGATVIHNDDDAQVDLIRTQRLAIAAGLRKNLDPDQPQHLTRAIVLAP